MTALIDTHRLVSDLKTSFGYSDKQAEGVAEAIRRIDLAGMVNKADLREAELRLTGRIDQAKITMLTWSVPLLIGQVAIFAGIVGWMR